MTSWAELGRAGSVAEQLVVWGVLNQLLGDFLGPALELVREQVNSDHPIYPLSPPDLADAVIRNYMSLKDATAEAAKSGLNAERFKVTVDAAGQPPGPEWLARAELRGNVLGEGLGADATSYVQGIAEGDTKNKWSGPLLKGSMEWPSPDEVINSYVRGQLTKAAAEELYRRTGGDPEWFILRYDTRGNPPAPMELVELARRGLIPDDGLGPDVLSLEQGIAEGDTKNKWYPMYVRLKDYIPPPRIITTLVKAGAITEAQAVKLFQDNGLTAELAADYLKSTKGEKMAGSHQLAQGAITSLYESQAIDHATAVTMLGKVGYSVADAEFELELVDLHRETAALNKAIGRIGTLYTARKITKPAAVETLTKLGVVGKHQAQLLATWDVEMFAEVKLPTPADIGNAVRYGGTDFTWDDGIAELVKLGYTPYDAYVVLLGHNHGVPAGVVKPAPGPVGPGVI